MNLLAFLCSDKVLDKACFWCCKQRESIPINQDLRYLRQNWHHVRFEIKQLISNGVYKFGSLQKHEHEGSVNLMFCMRDEIVVKSIAIVLNFALVSKLSTDCINLNDHTDVYKVLKFVNKMSDHPYLLLCSDTLECDVLKERGRLRRQIDYLTNDPIILNLIEQFLSQSKIFSTVHHQTKQKIHLNTHF